MTARAIVITGGDARYFPLLQECLRSVLAQPQSHGLSFGVLDCGLGHDDVAWCKSIGARVIEPGDDLAYGPALSPPPPSFRAMTARPWLPRYFPGFETYVWLDADVWVQDGNALTLLIDSAGLGDIAIVPELHRSYSNFRDTRDDFEAANGRAYAEAFGDASAARLIRRPLNNAGVFAMHRDSPGWSLWAEVLAEAAERSTNMIDQVALNVAIHERGLRDVRLPPTCNWISHLATPAVDAATGKLVEPDPPYAPIGILHMTLATKWTDGIEMRIANGAASERVKRSLRFPG
ncbi:MAG: hypothetical protein JSS20_05665 [Proteobacteria bacterium]|nr:hypothetical protein [Pseudomonadota bacterium]